MPGETRAERELRKEKAVARQRAKLERPGCVVVEREGKLVTLPRLKCLERDDGDLGSNDPRSAA